MWYCFPKVKRKKRKHKPKESKRLADQKEIHSVAQISPKKRKQSKYDENGIGTSIFTQ
jgi:hypothetical protein